MLIPLQIKHGVYFLGGYPIVTDGTSSFPAQSPSGNVPLSSGYATLFQLPGNSEEGGSISHQSSISAVILSVLWEARCLVMYIQAITTNCSINLLL